MDQSSYSASRTRHDERAWLPGRCSTGRATRPVGKSVADSEVRSSPPVRAPARRYVAMSAKHGRRPMRPPVVGMIRAAALAISGLGISTASAASTATAVWLMSETSGTTMTDSSGYANNGTTYNVTMTGANGYVFDPAKRSKVVVHDSATLDPGSKTFSYSVKVKTSRVPASGTDYDLLRKGVTATTGGEYKIEILNVNGQGRAFCLVKDS